MAEDTELPVENAPKTEIISHEDTTTGEIDKQEIPVKETDTSMLEDETMPTYLSITSDVSSLKPDDSKVQPGTHDPDTDDEDDKSVVEVSSDDEGQENNPELFKHNRNNDDDEDDDGDDDDDDDDDENDNDNVAESYEESEDSYVNGNPRQMRYHDESENDIDDEKENVEDEEDDEDSDGDIEPELFERSSDDYVLRTSNSSFEKFPKERSRSLQDLSTPRKLARANSKRQEFINTDHYDVQQYPFNYNDSRRNSQLQSRYSHVSSKVKNYIQSIKDQSRRSAMQKSSDQVNLNSYLFNTDDGDVNEETDDVRINPQCRRMKNYVKYELKNIMAEDLSSGQSVNNISEMPPVVNGDKIISTNPIRHYEQMIDVQEIMEVDDGNVQYINCNKQSIKPNGIIEYSKNNLEFGIEQKKNGVTQQFEPTINGQEAVGSIVDVQSLTYDNYMKGKIDNNKKLDETSNNRQVKTINMEEVIINPTNRSTISSTNPSENIVIEKLSENDKCNKIDFIDKSKIALAKSQVIAHTSIDNVDKKEDYEKMVNENLKLKREIEELKKALAMQQEEIKRKEVRIVAVQTEEQPRLMKHTSTTTHLQLPDKLSTDIGSTISSIEHWTDSDYSPVVSLKPPNIDHVLNSDQSTIQGVSGNPQQTPSQALWTTNRILKILADMSPGSAISNVIEKKFDVPGQSKETISPLITGGRNFRKRKASDSVGTSALGPLPSKIPFLNTTDTRRKFNSASDTDGANKSAGLSHHVAAAAAATDGGGAAASAAAAAGTSNQRDSIQNEQEYYGDEETDEDGIKCFVWHEDVDAHERSCLIQAPITHEGSFKTGEMRKTARECGPYLLGNLEVRITEANGTLNIWGKEINQDIKSNESKNVKEEQEESVNDSQNFWPKTPQTMLDNNFKTSTNKKIKTPTSGRGNVSRHLRGLINRTPLTENVPIENHSDDIPNLNQCDTNNCNSCHNHKRIISPTCHNHINSQIKSSCCAFKSEINLHKCGCRAEPEPIIVKCTHCHCEMLHRRAFPSSNINYHCTNIRRNHICTNHLVDEDGCEHSTYHRLSDSEPEDCFRHIPKRRCHSVERNICNHRDEKICRPETNSPYPPVEIDHVINHNKSHEIPEKRHRLRGKRVRNIMEFFKGCNDCRNPETSSLDSCQIPETEITNTRSHQSTRVISDPSSAASYTKHSNNSENHKNCNSYVKHDGAAAELEAELNVIRVEISKLHSRSNAMRDLLNRVLQADMNMPS